MTIDQWHHNTRLNFHLKISFNLFSHSTSNHSCCLRSNVFLGLGKTGKRHGVIICQQTEICQEFSSALKKVDGTNPVLCLPLFSFAHIQSSLLLLGTFIKNIILNLQRIQNCLFSTSHSGPFSEPCLLYPVLVISLISTSKGSMYLDSYSRS